LAFSNGANAELKNLNGKAQKVAKKKEDKREGGRESLQTSLNPVASRILIHGLGTKWWQPKNKQQKRNKINMMIYILIRYVET